MKTKLFTVIFSIMFFFLIHMKSTFNEPAYTIIAKSVIYSVGYVKVKHIIENDRPDNNVILWIPWSSISYISIRDN